MMANIGTLKELGVCVGDVVEWSSDNVDITHTVVRVEGSTVYLVENEDEHKYVFDWPSESIHGTWRIISRAHQQPKLWRDMTAEEKGALLLAAHEGAQMQYKHNIDWQNCNEVFSVNYAYRIKPDPKIETVALCWRHDVGTVKNKIGTFNLIDGKPDCASIKMEKV